MEINNFNTDILLKIKNIFLNKYNSEIKELLRENIISTKIFVYHNFLSQENLENEISILLTKFLNDNYNDNKEHLFKELVIYLMAYNPVVKKKEKVYE